MNDLMIDIETLGVSGKFAVSQVGACIFDVQTGEIKNKFICNLSIDEQLNKLGFICSSNVLLWHMENDIDNFKSCLKDNNKVSVFCNDFFKFIKSTNFERCWATATIDYQGIDTLFSHSVLANPIPYDKRLCARTVRKLYATKHPEFKYVSTNNHNALDDCIAQVKDLVNWVGDLI